MARSLARDAEDFARLMFHTVERLGQDGGWVRAVHAFEQTLADHPDHVYVAQLKAKPSRRIGLSAIAERMRAAEFPHLERRQAGGRRNAPLFYRIARPDPGLNLHLPYEVAPSHPLLVQRRAAAGSVKARGASMLPISRAFTFTLPDPMPGANRDAPHHHTARPATLHPPARSYADGASGTWSQRVRRRAGS